MKIETSNILTTILHGNGRESNTGHCGPWSKPFTPVPVDVKMSFVYLTNKWEMMEPCFNLKNILNYFLSKSHEF